MEEALGDAKAAKSLHTACKSHGKKTTGKRNAEDSGTSTSPGAKRQRLEVHKRDLDYSAMEPDELEASLELPLVQDEDLIRATTVLTNRAPLVLAFAVELLRFTKPEQPPSSRLSLAQAVVSANSRTKAISLGIEKAAPGGEEQVSEGQPRVRIMGREVPVLKRGGYTWSGAAQQSSAVAQPEVQEASQTSIWRASQKLTSKGSVFVAHATSAMSGAVRADLIKILMAEKPHLETADHNAWAVRTSYGNSPLKQEASFDDGESGCGKFMLQILRELDISNVVVVLTRWYGGVMLGPDRWRLMRECINDALSAQKRTVTVSNDPVWALNLEDKSPATSTVGMPIHRPEGARNYLLRAFPSAGEAKKGITVTAANEEKQENLGRLLGALRIVFESWSGVLSRDELDRRAWTWYVAVRPDVDAGRAGWGAKGGLNLGKILDLKRKAVVQDAS